MDGNTQVNRPERILVIGDDMRIFLAVVRSLGRAGLEVHAAPFNWHAPAISSRYITHNHLLPRYSDDPSAWRQAILDLVRTHSFSLIIPCCDRAIIPLHLHRDEFAGCRIAMPDPEEMTLLFDKERTRALCEELRIPVAAGARLTGGDDAPALATRFGLPLVVKPRKSFWEDQLDAAGKVWIVDTHQELEGLLAAIPDRSRYLVESFFPGAGVGVSVLAQDGELLQAFQHRRLREGRGGSSSFRISESINAELRDACRKICAHTRLTGVCMFEFRVDRASGRWILLETNARFWGSVPLPLSLGVDFPRLLFELLVHGRRHPEIGYAPGVKSRNLVLDGFNLINGLRYLRPSSAGRWMTDLGSYAIQPLRWLTGSERSDSFVWDDPTPGFWECAMLFKSIWEKLHRAHREPLARRRHDIARRAQGSVVN